MTGVRPCERGDLPRIAEMHGEIFLRESGRPRAPVSDFEAVFFDYPGRPADAHSYVWESETGQVQGFIGSVERPAHFREEPIRLSIATLLMVAPEARSSQAAAQVMRSYVEGPQQVKLADEANVLSRTLWARVGGFCALPSSLRWQRVLRPLAQIAAGGARRLAGKAAARVAAGLATPFDAALERAKADPPSKPPEATGFEAMDCAVLTEHLRRAAKLHALSLDYDPIRVEWVLDRARGRVRAGDQLKAINLRDDKGREIGCFVTILHRDGYAEVLLLLARRRQEVAVFQALCHYAWREGALALEGHLEAWMLHEPAIMRTLRYGSGLWTYVHTDDERLAQAFHRGEVLLPILDGEYPLGIG